MDNVPPTIVIDIANQQETLSLDEDRLRRAVGMVLKDASIGSARISLAVVGDPAIHELNRRYLEHDYPTDVISFVLESTEEHLEGEVIVSADTARESAATYGWSADDELLLYVLHGTLHLVGHDDLDPQSLGLMRRREGECLTRFGLKPRYDESPTELDETASGPGGSRHS